MSDHRLTDGRRAPACWVRARCPDCDVSEIVDAFLGVPTHSCATPRPIMAIEELVDPLDVPAETIVTPS